MDEKTEGSLTKVIYGALAFTFVYICINNIRDPWGIIALSGLLLLSITVRNALFYGSDRLRKWGKVTILTDIILIYLLNSIDRSSSGSIYYYVLIADAVLNYPYLFSIMISALTYFAYGIGLYASWESPALLTFIPEILFRSLAFISVTAVMLVVKYEVRQRDKLNETMHELKIKSRQLENTYIKLKRTSEELEEVTILKERNRIAREVHDTVGHTLTTVLMELEASERLVKLMPEEAITKISLAKGQVRKGLNDIRESVRALQAGRELMAFIPALKLLMEETTQHGEVFIDYEISDMPDLSPAQEKALYRALQEGLTNGIRHGKSTAFVFKLKSEKGFINFLLQDNGTGSEKIVKGFGLSAMEERLKELGGILKVSSSPGEGCTINITIPVGKEKLYG